MHCFYNALMNEAWALALQTCGLCSTKIRLNGPKTLNPKPWRPWLGPRAARGNRGAAHQNWLHGPLVGMPSVSHKRPNYHVLGGFCDVRGGRGIRA